MMKAVYPTGEEEKLLSIKWDFNWQLAYEFAPGKIMPKGTRIEGLNTYDNSPTNVRNPELPPARVFWGSARAMRWVTCGSSCWPRTTRIARAFPARSRRR